MSDLVQLLIAAACFILTLGLVRLCAGFMPRTPGAEAGSKTGDRA